MILLGDQVKRDEIGGARGTEGEDIYIYICISNFCRKSCRKETTCKRLGTFKDNNKLNLKEEDEKEKTGLIWLQIGKIMYLQMP